jgi:uncharacterized protein (DUF302 family)
MSRVIRLDDLLRPAVALVGWQFTFFQGADRMTYFIQASSTVGFDATIERVLAALKVEGFGVLSDIDVSATLKAKLDVDVPKYRILGACNPGFAHRALEAEPWLGVLLPCNVVVRETPAGRVEVAVVDPVVSLGRVGNDALEPVAGEVKTKLERALKAATA